MQQTSNIMNGRVSEKVILKCRHESVSMRPAQSINKTPSETGADNLLLEVALSISINNRSVGAFNI